jgi:flagellar protein FlbD
VIRLTRLNSQPFILNSDLIKCIEHAPDTVITLLTGEKILVRESSEVIVSRIILFRCSVLQALPSGQGSLEPGVHITKSGCDRRNADEHG